jgi:hypothetical protein
MRPLILMMRPRRCWPADGSYDMGRADENPNTCLTGSPLLRQEWGSKDCEGGQRAGMATRIMTSCCTRRGFHQPRSRLEIPRADSAAEVLLPPHANWNWLPGRPI